MRVIKIRKKVEGAAKILAAPIKLSKRMKDAAKRTNKRAEETQQSRHASPSEYASNNIQGTVQGAARKAAHSPNPVRKAVDNLDKAKGHFEEVKRQMPKERGRAAGQAKEYAVKTRENAEKLRKTADQAKKTAGEAKSAVKDAGQVFKETRQTGRQTLREVKQRASVKAATGAGDAVKTSANAAKPTKKAAKATTKGTIKTAKKSIKTAEKSAKAAVKTAQRTAKTAQKSAVAAAKTAKAAQKVAFVAGKAAVVTAKAAKIAVLAMVKAAIAAIKGLVALIAAGGWVAVAVILIICLVGLLVGSPFGIFFSGEDSGTGRTMPAVVSELTMEFYDRVEAIKRDNPHDILDLAPMSLNWPEILAVYAVKVSTDPDNPADVATLDDDRVARLRSILNDMAILSYHLSEHTEEHTYTDEDGEESTETVTIITLHISLTHKTADEMAALYGFDAEQIALLRELLDPEFADLWGMLLGGYVPGTGEILTGDTSRPPTSIFSWPLAGSWPISSPFGNRPNPFTGASEMHWGIDIAAPAGTPILAAADGTVIVANSTDVWGGGYGFFIKLQHEGGYVTLYAHCSRISVRAGQEVVKGEVIGFVGSTGRSTGAHLHWEIHRSGVRVDPLLYFG